jgi:hypothetical protein
VAVSLDAFYQLHLLAPRTHRKSAGVSPTNPGQPEARVSGFVHNSGLVASLRF